MRAFGTAWHSAEGACSRSHSVPRPGFPQPLHHNACLSLVLCCATHGPTYLTPLQLGEGHMFLHWTVKSTEKAQRQETFARITPRRKWQSQDSDLGPEYPVSQPRHCPPCIPWPWGGGLVQQCVTVPSTQQRLHQLSGLLLLQFWSDTTKNSQATT